MAEWTRACKTRGVAPKVEHPRCPFCREPVRPGADVEKRSCSACMAWHHAACWTEQGGCASCGHGDPTGKKKPRGVKRRPRVQGGQVVMHVTVRPGTHRCWLCGVTEGVTRVRRAARDEARRLLVYALFGGIGAAFMDAQGTPATVPVPLCGPCDRRSRLAHHLVVVGPLALLAFALAAGLFLGGGRFRAPYVLGALLAWAVATVVVVVLGSRSRISMSSRDQVVTMTLPRTDWVAKALEEEREESGSDEAASPPRERARRDPKRDG